MQTSDDTTTPEVRNPAEYRRLLDECSKVAGRGDWFWNERFVSALGRRGLTLATARHPHDRDEWYPSGYPMQLPQPYPEGEDAWPIGALVVWKPIYAPRTEGPKRNWGSNMFKTLARVIRGTPPLVGSLVLITDMPLDRATVDRLKAVVEQAFPGRRVLVLGDGMKIAAVSLAESAEDFVRRDLTTGLLNGLEASCGADR